MESDHYLLPEARLEHVGSEGVAEDAGDIEVQDAPPALALENTPDECPPPQQGTMPARLQRLFEKE